MNNILIMLIVLVVLQFGYIIYVHLQMRSLACDLGDAFYAERRFVYPILKEQGYNPDDYGEEATNPLTTFAKYSGHCQYKNDFIMK